MPGVKQGMDFHYNFAKLTKMRDFLVGFEQHISDTKNALPGAAKELPEQYQERVNALVAKMGKTLALVQEQRRLLTYAIREGDSLLKRGIQLTVTEETSGRPEGDESSGGQFGINVDQYNEAIFALRNITHDETDIVAQMKAVQGLVRSDSPAYDEVTAAYKDVAAKLKRHENFVDQTLRFSEAVQDFDNNYVRVINEAMNGSQAIVIEKPASSKPKPKPTPQDKPAEKPAASSSSGGGGKTPARPPVVVEPFPGNDPVPEEPAETSETAASAADSPSGNAEGGSDASVAEGAGEEAGKTITEVAAPPAPPEPSYSPDWWEQNFPVPESDVATDAVTYSAFGGGVAGASALVMTRFGAKARENRRRKVNIAHDRDQEQFVLTNSQHIGVPLDGQQEVETHKSSTEGLWLVIGSVGSALVGGLGLGLGAGSSITATLREFIPGTTGIGGLITSFVLGATMASAIFNVGYKWFSDRKH